MSHSERRQYFRVDDQVWLRLVPQEAPGIVMPPRLQALFALVRRLQQLQHEQQEALQEWHEPPRPLQRYLRLEQQKIEVLMQFGLREYLGTELPASDIVLSGNGLRCRHVSALTAGTMLQAQLVLFPEWQCLHISACVQRCETDGSGYQLSLHFPDLPEHERDLLLRHNMQIQMRRLREKNQGGPS